MVLKQLHMFNALYTLISYLCIKKKKKKDYNAYQRNSSEPLLSSGTYLNLSGYPHL